MATFRSVAVVAATFAAATAVVLAPTGAGAASSFATALTRAPYLTDLVGQNVAVNFATDRSATTGSVTYGAVGTGGSCTPTTRVTATRTSITVGSLSEYQWTAHLSLPAAGSYCYRPFLATTDLLGSATSPSFTTQVPAGSSSPYSFDVFGDWGQVDSSGNNADAANLFSQIASSGARFAMTVGDNGYPNGSQTTYGDLKQTGSGVSAIFGAPFWTVAGSTIPLFTAVGNHGVSGPSHADITTWTQQQAVASSGGRYQNDVYCCVNGSASSNYASEWYAFDAGPARMYVLDSAWGDTNKGSATTYANDVAAHFMPGTPEYEWLKNDLATHPSQLKFVFSHYPFYADSPTEGSDTNLDGSANLEGMLAGAGVDIVFNGHAHMYQRNTPSAPGMPITYVTGGGGGTLEPIGPCSAKDAYGIGWSPTKLKGYSCGAAPVPTAAARVFHFLKVSVSGTSVTVAPTDSTGQTFDVQTYTFSGPPETYIDSGPSSPTNSTSAAFTFHSSDAQATFTCSVDGGAVQPCTSPATYSGQAEGSHTFSVAATSGGVADPSPATATWTVDATPPSTPTNVTGTAGSSVEVDLSWSASLDNTGVTGYRVYRDGGASPYAALGAVTTFADTVQAGSTHAYTVTALDQAGNESAPSNPAVSVTTPAGQAAVFADGFDAGNLKAWTSSAGLTVESTNVRSGPWAAESTSAATGAYAKKTLPSTYRDGYVRTAFDVVSSNGQENLLRLRAADGTSLGYVYITSAGVLALRDDITATSLVSTQHVTTGWHVVEWHVTTDSTTGTPTGATQVWLDDTAVPGLSSGAIDLGAAPIGAMQIGEVQAGRSFDIAFDDAAFGTARLGAAARVTAAS